MLIRWLIIALFGAAVVFTGWYRGAYESWPGQLPGKLSWCDRTYRINRAAAGPDGRVTEVFRAPPVVGHMVFSRETRQETERRERANQVCGFALFMRTGDGYVTYALSE